MVVVTTCVIIDKDLIQGHQCDVKMPVALMNKKNNSAYDKTRPLQRVSWMWTKGDSGRGRNDCYI